MRFRIAEDDSKLSVSLEYDRDDVNIIITDSKGEDYVIAFLNSKGLTICEGVKSNEIITVGSRIVYQLD